MDSLTIVYIVCAAIGGFIFFCLVIKFIKKLICFRNKAKTMIEAIISAKNNLNLTKSKYLQVGPKSLAIQKVAIANQNHAYSSAHGGKDGSGSLLNGAFGKVDSNFSESSGLIKGLADDYEKAQKILNNMIKEYNQFIIKFPNNIYAAILRYKKEEYIGSNME